MDLFLTVVVLFLVANMAVFFTMLRRVNLDNESVIAWEQQAAHATSTVAVKSAEQPAYQVVRVSQ